MQITEHIYISISTRTYIIAGIMCTDDHIHPGTNKITDFQAIITHRFIMIRMLMTIMMMMILMVVKKTHK